MPRSNRPRRGGRAPAGPPHEPLDPDRALGGQRLEQHPDGAWAVRHVAGAAAGKRYRCPGCDQEIPPGTPHVVAWPADGPIGGHGDVGDRRHWHTPCWTARTRRRPR